MDKKVLIGTVITFVVLEIFGWAEHNWALAATYASLKDVWRPDMMDKIWISLIINLSNAFFFSQIFKFGYQNGGLMEGVRYGFYMGMLLSVGFGYGSYMSFNIPYYLALQWFLWGIATYMVAGVVMVKYYESQNKSA